MLIKFGVPAKTSTQIASVALIAMHLSMSACSVGWNHTSDAGLERFFNQHQAQFETLLAEVRADSQLMTLQTRTLIYAGRYVKIRDADLSGVERLGLSRERWRRYQKELRDLGLVSVIRGEGTVEFRVDAGSLLNGDSYKGYYYTFTPPDHIRSDLDGYRRSDQDKDKFGGWSVFKPLKSKWYLYLFVNA
jgi:hypothetical protein